MSTRKDKDGQWHVDICYDGKRVHRRLPSGSTARDAKTLDADILKALRVRARIPSVPGDPLLTDIFGDFVERIAPGQSGWERTKWSAYRIGPWLEGKRVSDTGHVCEKIKQDLQAAYADSSIARSLGLLARSLKLAYTRGDLDRDYSVMIAKPPDDAVRDRVLDFDEVEQITNNASPAVAAAAWLCYYTGMRRGEVCSLEARHVSTEDREILVPAGIAKTARSRIIPIATPALQYAERLPIGITPQGFRSGWDRARQKAGIPDAHIHDLRRTCGSLLVRAGVDLYVVSKILGHASTAITQKHYAHLLTAQLSDGLRRAFG